jgi:hypothetical protein
MEKLLAPEPFVWFVLLVFPGLISMHVYRLLMPARLIEWKSAIIESFFYSAVNFTLCLPIFAWFKWWPFLPTHPLALVAAGMFVIGGGPILWPWIWVKFARSKWMLKLQLPYPTAWDAFFDRRDECFVLLTLKDGKKIGGFFGEGGYASSFPNDGDLYLSAVYRITDDGEFAGPVPDTNGLLIRKDEYSFIEFFKIPKPKASHEQRAEN